MNLAIVAALMGYESIERLISPQRMGFDEALYIATIGLGVNLLCAWILRDQTHDHGHQHIHDKDHRHSSGSHQHDHNMAAAYLHVLADALTSVLAIAALLAGKLLGWVALDPAMGLLGAAIITHWAWGLMRRSARALIEADDTRAADLHVWRVGAEAYACIATVVTATTASADTYKGRLAELAQIRPVSVEVNRNI